jgi:hypothetical protein
MLVDDVELDSFVSINQVKDDLITQERKEGQ